MKIGVVSLLLVLLFGFNVDPHIKPDTSVSNQEPQQNCPVIIEYEPRVMFEGLEYDMNYQSETKYLERGEKVGEVIFKMNEVVCAGYKMKNGDATTAPIGTPIFKVKGYASTYRLFVGEDLYEVSKNPNAKTVGDFFDIRNKVKKISLISTEDHSHIADLSKEATAAFTPEFLAQKYVGMDEIHKKVDLSRDNMFFLKIYLQDESSFIIAYWKDQKVLTPGTYANDKISNILNTELTKINIQLP